MPKSTFLNLSDDKKDRITEVSIDEFSEHTYLNASINRIVKSAGIAKGSFYQYFKSKKDLYEYILEICAEKKLEFLSDVMKNVNYLDFFSQLKELYIAEAKFSHGFPKISVILAEYDKNLNNDAYKEVTRPNISNAALYEKIIDEGINNMDIDRNIDRKYVTYLLTSLNMTIKEYLVNEDKQASFMEVMDLIEKTIDLIRNGIKLRRRKVKNVEDRFY